MDSSIWVALVWRLYLCQRAIILSNLVVIAYLKGGKGKSKIVSGNSVFCISDYFIVSRKIFPCTTFFCVLSQDFNHVNYSVWLQHFSMIMVFICHTNNGFFQLSHGSPVTAISFLFFHGSVCSFIRIVSVFHESYCNFCNLLFLMFPLCNIL